MGGNDRQLVLRELESLRKQAAKKDRIGWRALWLVAVAAFVLLWLLFFRS